MTRSCPSPPRLSAARALHTGQPRLPLGRPWSRLAASQMSMHALWYTAIHRDEAMGTEPTAGGESAGEGVGGGHTVTTGQPSQPVPTGVFLEAEAAVLRQQAESVIEWMVLKPPNRRQEVRTETSRTVPSSASNVISGRACTASVMASLGICSSPLCPAHPSVALWRRRDLRIPIAAATITRLTSATMGMPNIRQPCSSQAPAGGWGGELVAAELWEVRQAAAQRGPLRHSVGGQSLTVRRRLRHEPQT